MSDIDKICKANDLKHNFVNAKSMDPENRIFKNDSMIIKIYYGKKIKYFANELEVYNGLSGVECLPIIYKADGIDDFKYIIMSRLEGKSLFDTWDVLNRDERIDAVRQIAAVLKKINSIKNISMDFSSQFKNEFYSALELLNNDYYKEYFDQIFQKLIQYINPKEECGLIHIDVHFYNFIYHDGIVHPYDFENTTLAPKDYQLVRWYRMWKYPQDYFYPKDTLSDQQIGTYDVLMPTLLDNYEELKNMPHLRERLLLYELRYLIQEINRCKLSEEKIKKYIYDAMEMKIYG